MTKAKPRVFSTKDFPLGIGSQWVYSQIDSSWRRGKLSVLVETVTVKIVGQTHTAEGHPARIWIHEFSKSRVDTEYAISVGDTVSFFKGIRVSTDTIKPSPYVQELTRFVFPLKVGSSWIGFGWGTPADCIKDSVVREDLVEVVSNKFRQGILVIMQNFCEGNASLERDYWIVRGVGLIQLRVEYSYSFAEEMTVESWKLVSYKISK